MYWRCVLERFRQQLVGVGIFVAAFFLPVALRCVGALDFWACLGTLFLWIALGAFVFLLPLLFALAMLSCATGRNTDGVSSLPGTVTGALSTDPQNGGGMSALPLDFGRGMDCGAAQTALAEAPRELRDAREALDEAIAASRRARRRLEAAMLAAGLSFGTVSESFTTHCGQPFPISTQRFIGRRLMERL